MNKFDFWFDKNLTPEEKWQKNVDVILGRTDTLQEPTLPEQLTSAQLIRQGLLKRKHKEQWSTSDDARKGVPHV